MSILLFLAVIGSASDATLERPNVLFLFAADSAVARGSHGLIGKQNVYEDSIRVPLILAGLGIPQDRRTDAMVYLFDVMPTLGKICNVPAPRTSEGVDFASTPADPAKPSRHHLMFAYRNVQRAVRDDRWKLIRYPRVNKTQLFDLKTDPFEIKNLADDPAHAGKHAGLTKLLEQEMTRFGDHAPLTVSNPEPTEWSPPAPTRPNSR